MATNPLVTIVTETTLSVIGRNFRPLPVIGPSEA
jgi:hypothetical protein